MSDLKTLILTKMASQGFPKTIHNEKLVSAIADGVKEYLNSNVKANVAGGSSSGSHKLVAS